MRLAIVLFFVFLSVSLFSQSDSLVIRDGKKYKAHLVQPKETLFGISKVYNFSVNEILSVNPGLEASGLQPGMQVLIPLAISVEPVLDNSTSITNTTDKGVTHKVEKKETLFGIAKRYNTSVNELLRLNPIIESEGLKEGMEIVISESGIKNNDSITKASSEEQNNLQRKDEKESPAFNEGKFAFHIVQKGETLYGIAKTYGVKVDSLIAINNGIETNLPLGYQLNIRRHWVQHDGLIHLNSQDSLKLEAEVFTSTIDSLKEALKNILDNSFEKPISLKSVDSNAFNVGLLLPVQLNNEKATKTKEIALSFYQGFKLAFDSLVNENKLNASIYLFDSELITNIDSVKGLSNLNLLVGPFFKEKFKNFQQFSNKHNIPIVAPVAHERSVLINNPNSFTIYPNQDFLASTMGDYIGRKHASDNILIFSSETIKDYDVKRAAKKALDNALIKAGKDSLRFSIFNGKQLENLKSKLVKDKINVVFVPSNESAFISHLMNSLMRIKGYKVKFFALESIVKMDNLDADFKNELQVSFASGLHYDYPKEKFDLFVTYCRANYGYDLDEFGYLGFDLGMYYGMLYVKYGSNFNKHLNEVQKNELYIKLKPVKAGNNHGYENKNAFIFQFSDYQLIQIN